MAHLIRVQSEVFSFLRRAIQIIAQSSLGPFTIDTELYKKAILKQKIL